MWGQEASRTWVSDFESGHVGAEYSLYKHLQVTEPHGAGQLGHLLQLVLCCEC